VAKNKIDMITSYNVNDDVQKQKPNDTSNNNHPAFIKKPIKYEEKN
jgi:hypothetical protein